MLFGNSKNIRIRVLTLQITPEKKFMTTNWNRKFTDLLRDDRPKYWGNWALDSSIKPGAIGVVDPDSGAFSQESDLKITDDRLSAINIDDKWQMLSESVRRYDGNASAGSSGSTTTVYGIQADASGNGTFEWSFGKEDSIASEFSLGQEKAIKDVYQLIEEEKETLLEIAKTMGKGDGKDIYQGFGFISSVLYAESGLNVGSLKKDNKFDLSGNVETVSKMIGLNDSVDAEASFSSTASTNETAISEHLFPSLPGETASTLTPIAYKFVSFNGEEIIVDWIGEISPYLTISFKNEGDYIADCTVTYEDKGQTYSHNFQLDGGFNKTHSIGDIPSSATNLVVECVNHKVLGHPTHLKRSWANPSAEWSSDTCYIVLHGTAAFTDFRWDDPKYSE